MSLLSHLHHLHSFPTRRSSDLSDPLSTELVGIGKLNMTLTEFGNKDGDRSTGSTFRLHSVTQCLLASYFSLISASLDRKSTRLNSSHVAISYAVFCLKKKITLS